MTAQVEGQTVKVGDAVGFKSDIEQYGIITAIKSGFGGAQLTLKPCGESFEGSYIRGSQSTTVPASSCWID
jgi:hypothetical protein